MKKTLFHNKSHQLHNFSRHTLALGFLCCIALFLLAGCANPGSGPDGGPYDETPPKILEMSPNLGQKNSTPKKVTLVFDELIKLDNASEKIIVSPPQIEMPEIKALGRKISVQLIDTMKPNTTYTIDFSDAIQDNNEGNPMGQFTYYFSTGEHLDTMEVAGNVISAEDLEPVKGILVGLHSDTTDTAFTTKAFDRVARTDGNGRFTIKGVAPGKYRIYALKDMDGNFMMNSGEMMAFSRELVVPSSFPDTRHDTLWRDTVSYDTIMDVKYTHYLPDDLVLRAFTEKKTQRYLLKTQRDNPENFRIYFTAPSPVIPIIKGLNFDEEKAFLEERSPGNDTITYWLRDFKHFPSVDTLLVAYTYDAYDDSLQANVFRTDTFDLIPRHTLAKRLKDKEKELEKWEKRREKRHKKGDFSQEVPPFDHLKLTSLKAGRIAPTENVHLCFEEPLTRIDTAGIHLVLMKDSSKVEMPYLLERDERSLTNYTLTGEWRPGQRYELQIDSAAVTGISGKSNFAEKSAVNIPKMEEYGALFLILPDADTSAVVQILSGNKVIRQQPVTDGRADIFYLSPGKIYIRMFNDYNQNGIWDTGRYADCLQPEDVFYFPVSIDIRANWDVEQNWRVRETPLTRQKPQELIKQKEDKKKKDLHKKNADRERERGKRK